MATIWKGSLTFGLVNIPVELKAAVRSDHIGFRLLHEEDLSPVKYERVCAKEGESIPWNEIVKGYEYEKGKFVVLTDRDFETAALETSKTIDILDFVKQEQIDPRFFETPYYVVPTKGGEKAYALLREAIRKTDAVGIGKVIIRQAQHLAAVKVVGNALVLEIMRFANELVDISTYTFPANTSVRSQELQMAQQLIGNLQEPFHPEKYTDEYRENLMRVIKAKMKGKKAKLREPNPNAVDGGVIDLMARLQQSLKGGARKRSSAKSPAARPSTSKKAVVAHAKSRAASRRRLSA